MPGKSSAAEPAVLPAHTLVISVSIASSALLFGVLNYFAATRTAGSLTWENSGYFLGRCVGALLLGALVVLGYRKIRGTKLRGPVQALVVMTLSSLFTLMTLALPARPRMAAMDEATLRRYAESGKNEGSPDAAPAVHTKWDPAARALLKDISERNQQYVAEISSLDETAKPLYTVESFHDAATIQQMIEQLRTRLTVADKYTDWQPVFSKMKEYVAAVDASEDEKHKFLEGYEATLPNTLAVCKVISDKEHAWLQASLDLYQFALSRNGRYAWQPDHLAFQNHSDSETFRKKFLKARGLNAEFLKAYWEVRRAQEVMMAQLGLQDPGVSEPH